MGMSVEQLLILVSFFEKRACALLKKVSKVDVYHNFIWALSSLIGQRFSLSKTLIDHEELESWAEKNASIIGNYLDHRFDLLRDENEDEYHLAAPISSNSSSSWIRIYKTPMNFDNFEAKQSIFLPGEGKIPNLWMYIGDITEKPSGLEKMSPEMSHDAWLVNALCNLVGSSPRDKFTMSAIDAFMKEHKQEINSIRRSFQTLPQEMNRGLYTSIFSIGPNLVLKIFKDKVEFAKTKEAMERLHGSKSLASTEAMVYDVGLLGTFMESNVFYSIVEKMKVVDDLPIPVKTGLKSIIDHFIRSLFEDRESWKPFKKNFSDISTHENIKKVLADRLPGLVENIRSKFGDSISDIEQYLPNLKSNWLQSLLEEIIVKFLSGRGDLHLGNLGLTNYGNFRYFDPAHGNHTETLNSPSSFYEEPVTRNYFDIDI